MSKKFTLLLTLAIWSLAVKALAFSFPPNVSLPTYFNYSEEELAPLYKIHSSQEMSPKELQEWDRITSQLVEQKKIGEVANRLYPYLYVAQRDAAYLSYYVKQRFEGSLSPISSAIVKLFVPDFVNPYPQREDDYSRVLAAIVLKKLQARLEADRQQSRLYEQKEDNGYWVGKKPFYGQETGSWKTWFLTSGSQFRLPQPPANNSPEWKKQIKEMQETRANLTEEQKQKVFYWAGMGKVGNGDWRELANEYMWSHRIPFNWMLFIRSTLAMALADASIAVFDSKYTYWVKRPAMMDPSVKEMLPSPNHPSYPSGHSAVSTTAATLLTYFFPQDREVWMEMAQECGVSRLWCGIHFPIDNEMGQLLGKKIGQTAIRAVQQSLEQFNQEQLPAPSSR